MINKKFTLAAVAAAAMVVAPIIGSNTAAPVSAATRITIQKIYNQGLTGHAEVRAHGAKVYASPTVSKSTGRVLKAGTLCKTYQFAESNNPLGNNWANIGRNQWVREADLMNQSTVGSFHGKIKLGKYNQTIWNSYYNTKAGKMLKHGTTWKTYQRAYANGTVWYDLGHNQWIDGQGDTVLK